jgi:hypothetical protein
MGVNSLQLSGSLRLAGVRIRDVFTADRRIVRKDEVVLIPSFCRAIVRKRER